MADRVLEQALGATPGEMATRMQEAQREQRGEQLAELIDLAERQDTMWSQLQQELAPGAEPPAEWVEAHEAAQEEDDAESEEDSEDEDDGEEEAARELQRVLENPRWKY